MFKIINGLFSKSITRIILIDFRMWFDCDVIKMCSNLRPHKTPTHVQYSLKN